MKTLSDALQKVQQRAISLAPVDIDTRVDRYHYRFDGNAARAIPFGADGHPLLLHDLALRQLTSRIGVPLEYLRRCPRALAELNVNYFSQEGPYKRESQFRTIRGNQVRAILSESYAPFDDADLLPMVAAALGDDDVQVQLMDLSDHHSHFRILFPRLETEAKPGDVIRAGIHISNSEVGLRGVIVESIAYRLVCTNGLVSPFRTSRISARHVGNPNRLREFVRTAVSEAKSNIPQLLDAYKATVHHRIEEPVKLIERTANEGGLSQEQMRRILQSLTHEEDSDSLYGVINAFTRAAQGETTLEDRYQFERVGSSLLRLA
jgi:hypothetical protein